MYVRETITASDELTSAGLLHAAHPPTPFVPVVTVRDNRIMTPLPVARAIIAALRPSGTLLEPFAGDGSFVRALEALRPRALVRDRPRPGFLRLEGAGRAKSGIQVRSIWKSDVAGNVELHSLPSRCRSLLLLS